MSILRMLVRAALTALLLFALPSWASDLPTSENPTKGNWSRMTPASFAPTSASALEQCLRAANADAQDRLTPAMCKTLEEKLKGSECRKVLVADGVVFDFMNGRSNGRSGLTRGVEKKLGRSDPALLCEIGNRTYAYWFVGDKGKSCNNIGIVFTATPVVMTSVDGACGSNAKRYSATDTTWPAGGNFCTSGEQSSPSILFPQAGSTTKWSCVGSKGGEVAYCEASRDAVSATLPPALKCEWVSQRYIIPQAGQFIHVPGLSVAVCRGQVAIPDTFVNIPGDVMTVTRQVEVCR